jgi:aquaporin Z
MNDLSKKDWAELIGTAGLIYLAAPVLMLAGLLGAGGPVGAPLAFVLALPFFLMYMVFHKVSGGHFNPAISIAMWMAGKMDKDSAMRYVTMQGIGAAAGAVLFYVTMVAFSDFKSWDLPNLGLAVGKGHVGIILHEAVFTALFVFVYMYIAANKEEIKFKAGTIMVAMMILGLFGAMMPTVMNPIIALLVGLLSGGDGIVAALLLVVGAGGGAYLASMVWGIFNAEDKPAAAYTPPAADPTPPPADNTSDGSDDHAQ